MTSPCSLGGAHRCCCSADSPSRAPTASHCVRAPGPPRAASTSGCPRDGPSLHDTLRPPPDHVKGSRILRILPPPHFTSEIITSFRDRPAGVRVKHWVRGNSLKMYDKAGSVLRVETSIARTGDFKVLRPAHDDPHGARVAPAAVSPTSIAVPSSPSAPTMPISTPSLLSMTLPLSPARSTLARRVRNRWFP